MNTKYFYNYSSKLPLLTSLILFAMLLLSSVAQGQAQHASVTIGNGQETNQYVPIYGFYCDDYLRCQILYSASDIQEGMFATNVTGATIKAMTFYLVNSASESWGNASFKVKIKEVPTTTTSLNDGYVDMSDATLVFEDTLNAQGNTMTVNFSVGMVYNGGNLVVEIGNYNPGTYSSSYWYGITRNGASVSGTSSTSVAGCPAIARNYLPKTTFRFENGTASSSASHLTVGNEASSSTSIEVPLHNYYKYSMSETIIDQSELGEATTFGSISFKYAGPGSSSQKNDVTIWIQPTTKNTFSSSSDIELLNNSTAVKVYEGPLNCHLGWNEFVFTTPYQYDGTGNLMLIVDDNGGGYDGNNYEFSTSSCTGDKTLVWFDDNRNPDPGNSSYYGFKSVCQYRVTMRLNKEWSGPVIKFIDFHDGTINNFLWTGSGYSTGVVTSGDNPHGQTGRFSFWHRVLGTDSVSLELLSGRYPYLWNEYFSDFISAIHDFANPDLTSADNGFMMMSMVDQREPNTGNFNAYINLGVVDASQAPVVDVRFYQYYRKYYDYCYIDWRTSSSGQWNSMEINVRNEDVEVNNSLWGYYTYTLPLAAAGHSYLEIRLRYFSSNSHFGNVYGYLWIVDDVSIIAGDANRMIIGDDEYVYGGYGIVPQNMKFKPAWYTSVINNGSQDQHNVTVHMNHLDNNLQTVNELGSYNNGTASVADPQKELILDPEGWFDTAQLNYRGWDGLADHDNSYGTCATIPTAATGDHYLFASVTTQEGLEYHYDTMHYTVSSFDNSTKAYIWAKDNGVLCYNPYNYYIYGWVLSNDNYYVAIYPDAHYDSAGYSLNMRYTTGSEVPSGWVIRGMEMVASPVPDVSEGIGAKLEATLTKDEYDGSNVVFSDIYTGANIHQVTANEINTANVIGRNSNGYLEPGNYNTIRIMFPEQPELEPNTSYRVGYRLVENASFALAQTMNRYQIANPSRPNGYDTIIYFRDNPATFKYANPFDVNRYDVYAFDPIRDRWFRTHTYDDNPWEAPMIRLLVGPAQQVNRVNIDVQCEYGELGEVGVVYMTGSGELCGTTVTPVEGSLVKFNIETIESHYTANIYLDGRLVEPNDEGYERKSSTWIILSIPHVTGNHVLRVVFSDEAGIAEREKALVKVYPNPTSGMVTVSATETISHIELFSANGSLVRGIDCSDSVVSMDLDDLPAGIYMMAVRTSRGIVNKRVVVK